MKKGIKISAATVMVLSAITPVAAFAAEPETTTAVKDGYYINNDFMPAADFAAKTKKEKAAFIKENITAKIFIVLKGKVYDLTDVKIQNAKANEVESLGKAYEVFKTETGIELTENGVVLPPVGTELKVESVSAINGTVSVVLSKAPEAAPTLADFTVTRGGSSVTPQSITWNPATKTATFKVAEVAATDVAQTVTYAVAYKSTASVSSSFTIDAIATEFSIASVEVTTLDTIKIVYNQPVNKLSAETVTNYKLGATALKAAVGGDTAKLQDDGKTVIITLGTAVAGTGPLTKDTSHTLSVFDVLTQNGTKMIGTSTKPAVKTLYAKEEAKPTVVDIHQSGPKQFTVRVSESLAATAPAVKVNGQVASSVSTPTAQDKTFTISTANNIIAGQTYEIYIAGIEDLYGNFSEGISKSVVATGTEAGPVVNSITGVDQDTVRVVFDRTIDASAGSFKIQKGATIVGSATNMNATSVVADTPQITQNLVVDPTGKTYDINVPFNFDGVIGRDLFTQPSTTSETITFNFTGVKDNFGNVAADFAKSVTLTKDTVAPTVQNITLSADKKKLLVQFSERIAENSTNFDNIKVRDAEGITVALTTASIAVNGTDNTIVELPIGAGTFTSSSYTVVIPENTVVDGVTLNKIINADITLANGGLNGNAAVTKTVSLANAGVKPTVTITKSSANIFKLAFSEKMGASALDPANYLLDGKALPAGADLYFTDNNKNEVRVDLTAEGLVNTGVVNSGVAGILTAKNTIKSDANVAVDTTTTSVASILEDNTPAVLKSAQVVGNSIILTFDEALDQTTAADANIDEVLANYEIYAGTNKVVKGGTPGVATAALVAGDGKKVQISFTTLTGTNFDASKTITVQTLAGGDLVDANGYKVKANVKMTATK